MKEKLEYEKSAWRVWLFALLGIPFLLIGADFFFEQKLIEFLRKLIYGAEELGASDPRDRILASLFIIVGAVLTLWGLKELIFPKKILVADRAGLHLAVTGLFQRAALVPWDKLSDIEYKVIDDEGDARPVVTVEVTDRSGLPDYPWGARWIRPGALLIDATGWSPSASGVVDSLWQLRKSIEVGTADGD